MQHPSAGLPECRPLCTGFLSIEDVAVGRGGWLYVGEDDSGLIILVRSIWQIWLPVVLRR
jgi:hypothetical protein